MIWQVCAVYDKKVGCYSPPQFFRAKGEAIRAFMDAVAAEGSPFGKHAQDYHFSLLGDYDDNSGTFVSEEGPVALITALECLKALPDTAERVVVR